LAASQTPGEAGKRWFQGTADAVRQVSWIFDVSRCSSQSSINIIGKIVGFSELILSGSILNHLCRIPNAGMLSI